MSHHSHQRRSASGSRSRFHQPTSHLTVRRRYRPVSPTASFSSWDQMGRAAKTAPTAHADRQNQPDVGHGEKGQGNNCDGGPGHVARVGLGTGPDDSRLNVRARSACVSLVGDAVDGDQRAVPPLTQNDRTARGVRRRGVARRRENRPTRPTLPSFAPASRCTSIFDGSTYFERESATSSAARLVVKKKRAQRPCRVPVPTTWRRCASGRRAGSPRHQARR